MKKEVKKVRVGDTVAIDGVNYRFGKGSNEAFNIWLDLLEHGADDTDVTIDLFTADGKGGESFHPSKIKEALEREDWNKTAHGL